MNILKNKAKRVGLFILLALTLGAVVVASPLGRVIDRQLTAHFRQMNERRASHRLSWGDGMVCQVLYTGIALGGRALSPEGGKVIWHYLHGQGKDLLLSPNYIKTSPVIIKSLALLKEGESRRFTFRQAEDFRLSYAVNPFNLKKKDGKVLLWQLIKFEANSHTYSTLNYGVGAFQVPDALIYSVHPQTFTVYSTWSISK